MTIYGMRALRQAQVGLEVTHGTPVACTAALIGSTSMRETREVKRPTEDLGALTKFVRSYVSKKAAEINWEGDATFEQALYFLRMGLMGAVTPSLVEGSTGAYEWEFMPSLAASGEPDSFSIKAGDNLQAWIAEYCMASNIGFKGAMGEPLGMTATMFGRQLTDASFDALIVPTVETIQAGTFKVYVDDLLDDIGTTQLLATVHDLAINIDTGVKPVFLADGSLSFSVESIGPRGMELDMTLWFNTGSLAERAKWAAQAPRFIKLEATGSEIEAGFSKKLTLLMRAKYIDWAALSEKEGLDLVAVKLASEADLDGDFEFGVTVVNGLDALP